MTLTVSDEVPTVGKYSQFENEEDNSPPAYSEVVGEDNNKSEPNIV